MNKKYDYLIVGAGLYGATFAHEMTHSGKKCLVIDKRSHIGGNIYTKNIDGINAHMYGAHIFHTNNKDIWDYINEFAVFNNYINSPIANYKGSVYNLPFNMNTFTALWGVVTPEQAREKIREQVKQSNIGIPCNLEEQAIKLVGLDIYNKLIKGYSEKQWGRPCKELPAFIIKRLPLRFEYNNNYYDDLYQGIPVGGYTQIVSKMLHGSDVELNTDFLKHRALLINIANRIVYTGCIDAFYDYCFGSLEYRTLKFETEIFNTDNYQGNAVINYTDAETPYTRSIEHKHFEFGTQKNTVITWEYPHRYILGGDPYYPINDNKNMQLYNKYLSLANGGSNIIFCGRLGQYKYFDMDEIVEEALKTVEKELLHY